MGAEPPQWTAAIKAAGVDSRKKPEGRAGSPRLVETVHEAPREAVHYFDGSAVANPMPSNGSRLVTVAQPLQNCGVWMRE